jgi:hypothetical protein
VLERSVILTTGNVLHVEMPEFPGKAAPAPSRAMPMRSPRVWQASCNAESQQDGTVIRSWRIMTILTGGAQ